MNHTVLLLTSIFDFSADLVALRLEELGESFIRINKEHLPVYRLTLDPIEPSLSIFREEKFVGSSSSFKSIWFRQPIFFRNTPPTPLLPEDQLQRSQWMAFIRAFSVFDNIRWMNWPQATYLAESKPYQLLVASRCGLQVPPTLIGNDSKKFRERYQSPIVVKSLDTVLLREGNESLFTYTTQCNINELTEESVSAVPLIVQEFYEHKTDYRVTVIGEKVFSIKILEKGIPVKGDWRTVPKERLEYVDIELPQKIINSCKMLIKELNLSFGAIDLLETNKGFIFLEINPTGEWGWLNNEQRPLDLYVAKWLATSCH